MADVTTPIVSPGTVTARAIQRWFERQAARYGPSYGPFGRTVPPPADLGAAIVAECRRYPDHVVNWDWTAAQVCHETAGWQSAYARERNNPGGIGAINSDPDQALWFPSVAAGLRAHVAHLLVYAAGDGPWSADDPRRDAVRRMGWLGAAPRWVDLGGKWAFPGQRYAQSIGALVDDLIAFAATLPEEEASPVEEPAIRQDLLPEDASNVPNRPMTPRWITIHETGNPNRGATAAMHARWLHSLAAAGADEPSWHYTVDDREIVQHLPTDRMGWHAGDGANGTGNRESIGVELCVNADGDFDATIARAARLVAWLMRRHGIPLDRVVQHNHWSGKDCPHRIRSEGRWDGFLALVARAAAPEPAPAPGGPPPLPVTVPDPWGSPYGTFWIPEPFVAEIRRHDWLVTGYCLTGAMADGEQIVQWFERARLELNRDGSVTRGLVGREALEARGRRPG